MSNLRKLLKKICETHPEIKEEIDKDREWRNNRKQNLIKEGILENEADQQVWVEYWEMVKARDGVEFSINRLE